MSPQRGPAWVRHAIWWHVYPLGFVGADTTGRADGAERTPSGSPAPLDRLTNWLDHAVGLGLNGLALGPIFESGSHGYDTVDHLRLDRRLGDEDAFARLVAAARERGVRIMLDGVFNHVGRDFRRLAGERSGWLRRGEHGEVVTFEGHEGLLALDHREPAVADYVADVMTHWLDAGADAWRLDAAYAVPPDFWAAVLPRVRERHPEAYIVGEVLHGDYPDYVRRSGVDAVTQYELWKAIWSSLDQRNLFELDWALRRHAEFVAAFSPWTFVGNHDVTRIASQISDFRHHAHAVALLLFLPGTPAIYYGDELGLRAVKEERVGGDDAIRPAFPGSPTSPDGDGPDGEGADGDAADVFRLHQSLVDLRRRHPWLHDATVETLALTNETLVLRARAGDERLVLALNLGDDPLPVDGSGEIVAGFVDAGRRVPPHGWAVLGP